MGPVRRVAGTPEGSTPTSFAARSLVAYFAMPSCQASADLFDRSHAFMKPLAAERTATSPEAVGLGRDGVATPSSGRDGSAVAGADSGDSDRLVDSPVGDRSGS